MTVSHFCSITKHRNDREREHTCRFGVWHLFFRSSRPNSISPALLSFVQHKCICAGRQSQPKVYAIREPGTIYRRAELCPGRKTIRNDRSQNWQFAKSVVTAPTSRRARNTKNLGRICALQDFPKRSNLITFLNIMLQNRSESCRNVSCAPCRIRLVFFS